MSGGLLVQRRKLSSFFRFSMSESEGNDPGFTSCARLFVHWNVIWKSEYVAIQIRARGQDGAVTKGPSKARLRHRPDRRSVYKVPGRSEEHTSELQSLAYLVC